MTKRAVYEFLLHMHNDPPLPRYGAFTAWCRRTGLAFGAAVPEAHPQFETPPGRQLRFDWKEGVRMVDANGEALEFNVFTATPGYSRRHVLIPAPGRTTDDLLACPLQTFRVLGGVPEELVTGNMSALVSLSGGRRRRVERTWRFAEEAGCRLVLCAPRSPETKGKDESADRFLSRLAAYESEFADWEGLRGRVAQIEARSNEEPNATTGPPPAALFMREKEPLRPVGNMALLESMVGDVSAQVVPPTILVRAAGRQWSVPRRCIGRRVGVVAMPGDQVCVRMAGEEAAVYDAGAAGPIVYEEAHCLEALEGKR